MPGSASVPFTFVSGQTAQSAQVNSNFTSITAYLNNFTQLTNPVSITNASATLVIDYGVSVAGTVTIAGATGGLAVSPTIAGSSAFGNVVPGYTTGGANLGPSVHYVYSLFTATSTTTNVSLTGPAIFPSARYGVNIFDNTTGTAGATVVAQVSNNLQLTTVSGHVYIVTLIGP